MINRRHLVVGMTAVVAMPDMAHSGSGYFVPAEDGRHMRTFMQWPVSRAVYPDRSFLDEVQAAVARIANAIVDFEPVVMLADASDHRQARKFLSEAVELWDIPTEDLWCRDSGPIFVVDGQGGLAVRGIAFNGWGGRQVHGRDGRIAALVAQRLGCDLLPSPLTGEAGGVEQDGHGLLIAHESSWVNANRNPGMSRADVTRALIEGYGADRLIWSRGLFHQDITDYHIDSLARLTGPDRVLINLPEAPDRHDPFHRAARETHVVLQEAGLQIDVIPEPTTRRVPNVDFVASYANFYVCNGAVIAAEFGDTRTDALARDALHRHFPGREVVSLNVDAIGLVGGGIHCATREQPAVARG